MQDFQEGRNDYAVLAMLAAGTGVTLDAGEQHPLRGTVFCTGVMLQAEDRSHRIGLTEPLTVTYVLANGSLDAHMFKNIKKKLSTIDRCLDNRTDRVFME